MAFLEPVLTPLPESSPNLVQSVFKKLEVLGSPLVNVPLIAV